MKDFLHVCLWQWSESDIQFLTNSKASLPNMFLDAFLMSPGLILAPQQTTAMLTDWKSPSFCCTHWRSSAFCASPFYIHSLCWFSSSASCRCGRSGTFYSPTTSPYWRDRPPRRRHEIIQECFGHYFIHHSYFRSTLFCYLPFIFCIIIKVGPNGTQ